MARNEFPKFLEEVNRVFGTSVFNGARAAAERTVRELQQEGPSWSGQFSNSWQIQTPSRTVKGDGGTGEPRPINAPTVTTQEAARSIGSTNKIVFKISNFSPYAAEATDQVEATFRRPTPLPQTQLGRSKWEVSDTGRVNPGLRGRIGGGSANGEASRTAPLDWFPTYVQGGNLDKAVKIEMDAVFNTLR